MFLWACFKTSFSHLILPTIINRWCICQEKRIIHVLFANTWVWIECSKDRPQDGKIYTAIGINPQVEERKIAKSSLNLVTKKRMQGVEKDITTLTCKFKDIHTQCNWPYWTWTYYYMYIKKTVTFKYVKLAGKMAQR